MVPHVCQRIMVILAAVSKVIKEETANMVSPSVIASLKITTQFNTRQLNMLAR